MKLKEIEAKIGTLSNPAKMPSFAWGIPIEYCVTGTKLAQIEGTICNKCYAGKGCYVFPVVRAMYEKRYQAIELPEWVDYMAELITQKYKNKKEEDRYHRWFDSGDCYHRDLAIKICEVMLRTPDTKHWFPTRMHKFDKFKDVLYDISILPNVVLRVSSDSVTGECLDSYLCSSVIVPWAGFPTSLPSVECDAYKRGGKCGDCRACWSKDVKIVSYPYHGVSKAKVMKLIGNNPKSKLSYIKVVS